MLGIAAKSSRLSPVIADREAISGCARIASPFFYQMNLFHQQDCGSRAEMLLSQLLSIPTFSREGGLFIAVGRKLGEAA
jgi:hypothetical protein